MINPSDFIHPEDEMAQKTLDKIPGFRTVAKKFLEYGFEKLFYGKNLASSIRLSPTQLPQIYKRLPPICEKLGMEEPEFYLQMDPMPNACTFGDKYKFIAVTSGLLETFNDDEIDAVIAHECGHILCHHTLYHSVVSTLISQSVDRGIITREFSQSTLMALLYWKRKSELSCDRVAAVITSPDAVTRIMARFSGGSRELTANLNMDEWAAQAEMYEELYRNTGVWESALQICNTVEQDHPFAAVRVREILNWGRGQQYLSAKSKLNNISHHRCRNCGKVLTGVAHYCLYCGRKIY